MKKLLYFSISFVCILPAYSCTKGIMQYKDNEHIKSVFWNGAPNQMYFYNQTGNIVEQSSLYRYSKYVYDENERLIKVETAFDPNLFSSSLPVQKTEFMTSQNSTITQYSLYEYGPTGRLLKTESYLFNETDKKFEYRSTQTFEYEGSFIAKVNVHDLGGAITNFHVYLYDDRGNVVTEKQYSNLLYPSELIRETFYKYDNHKNPFLIFSILGAPGLYSNANNIIETTSVLQINVPGIDKFTNSKTTYQYNKKGYPAKVMYENGVEEYKY